MGSRRLVEYLKEHQLSEDLLLDFCAYHFDNIDEAVRNIDDFIENLRIYHKEKILVDYSGYTDKTLRAGGVPGPIRRERQIILGRMAERINRINLFRSNDRTLIDRNLYVPLECSWEYVSKKGWEESSLSDLSVSYFALNYSIGDVFAHHRAISERFRMGEEKDKKKKQGFVVESHENRFSGQNIVYDNAIVGRLIVGDSAVDKYLAGQGLQMQVPAETPEV